MKRAILLNLLLAGLALAATRKVQYVDPAATGTGDGSSWTNAYTTGAAWANQDTDLVTADQYLQTYFRSSGAHPDDTTAVAINNWGTSATCTIEAIQDPNNYHNGVFNDNCYHLKVGAAVSGITVSEDYVSINGLQVTGIATSYQGIYLDTGYGNNTVKNCLIQDFTRGGSYGGIYVNGGTARSVYNNIVWNCNNGITTSSATCTLAHNTLSTVTYGISIAKGGSTVVTAKNNIIHGATTCWIAAGSGSAPVTAYNWTSDATSPDGATYQDQTFTFIGGEDYHLNSSENAKYNSADPSVSGLTTDIDGNMRIGWEGGADEIPNPGKPALAHHLRRSY